MAEGNTATDVTVAEAEELRQRLERGLTNLVAEFEARTGMKVVGLDAGNFIVFENIDPNRTRWRRNRGVQVEVRL